MAKALACRDIGLDCDWTGSGETVDEIMRLAAEHAAEAHGITEIPNELAARVRQAISDE